MGEKRAELIRDLWPDKTMQAALVILLASGASLIFYAERAIFEIRFSDTVPAIMRAEASQVMAFLALLAGVFAIVALNKKHVGWGWAAVAMSALSVGPLASGILCALIAAGFLVFAHKEGEHQSEHTRAITTADWPDKAFAASLVLMIAGVIALLWGGALIAGLVEISSVSSLVLGAIALIAGAGTIAAAILARRQRAFGASVAAAIGAIATLGFYVVGPLLGIVALVLLWRARSEGEFE